MTTFFIGTLQQVSPRCMASLLCVVMVGIATVEPMSGAEPEVRLESVAEIFSDGQWNGRPGLVFWKDHYRISFRSGS
jgi:hypothetical protein